MADTRVQSLTAFRGHDKHAQTCKLLSKNFAFVTEFRHADVDTNNPDTWQKRNYFSLEFTFETPFASTPL